MPSTSSLWKIEDDMTLKYLLSTSSTFALKPRPHFNLTICSVTRPISHIRHWCSSTSFKHLNLLSLNNRILLLTQRTCENESIKGLFAFCSLAFVTLGIILF